MKKSFSAHHDLADLLLALQGAMQDCEVWDCEMPTVQALASTQPFCIDTMAFQQWLRFVMLERFKIVLETGATLPTRCHISPMAEEAFKAKPPEKLARLVTCLDNIDAHLSGAL